MREKNRGQLLICIIALTISFLAIIMSIIAFWSSYKPEYDNGNAILSAFSIIVTILIGAVTVLIAWQVYNHYVAKDEVRKMTEEESLKLAGDIIRIIESTAHSSQFISFSSTDNKNLDDYMQGIASAKGCENSSLREYCINFALVQFHNLYLNSKERGEMHITKGKRKEYEHLCNNIDHKYIEELKDYIQNAVEVEDEL